jgi:beta-galactosidase
MMTIRSIKFKMLGFTLGAALTFPLCAQQGIAPAAPLVVSGDHFLLKDKPFRILSGELHYPRIPRAYWRDRLKKARALGLNAVTVYVFWNMHEPQPGVYDFTGNNDVAEFLREAQQEGLYVILRPGPYSCAEWDLGGYPAWLLKDHNMVLRSSNKAYMDAAGRWLKRLGQELAPLQASHGGPIIAVQVENEYGSFGDDHAYMEQIHQLVLAAGFDSTLLYTGDGADVLAKGTLPELPAGIDFGTGDADRSIALFRKFRPTAPTYVAEYWDGWFDHWGEKHQLTDAAKQESDVRSMLMQGASLSLYMLQGGTSFGWMNGANTDGKQYQPDVSSYDYDAAIDESGRPRPKYFALRQAIAEITGVTPPPAPVSPPMIGIAPIALTKARPLWGMLSEPVLSQTPLSMEDVDQAYGYILYRTEIEGSGPTQLTLDEVHSYARIFLDGKQVGRLDRRLNEKTLMLDVQGKHRLDILVENTGRINFTVAIRGERAGITHAVLLGGRPLTGWQIFRLPFAELPSNGYTAKTCVGPCLYQASFHIDTPGDTYLNTEKLGKGVIWVNGHLLGRFWNVGPMGSLFLPGVWLHEGENTIAVFDLNGGSGLSVAGQDHANFVDPRTEPTP